MTAGKSSFGPNIIDTAQIFDSAITGNKIAALTVTGANIAASTITSDKLNANVIVPSTALTTTARKALVAPATGLQIYDTTLNKPVWYNGSAWTDATGTPLVGG
jgi:hypothetical protein